MDTAVGRQRTSTVLLVLSESQIIFKIDSKSQYCVVKALDKLERMLGAKRFREKFKTITCDNGCENLDYEGIERYALTKQTRTKVCYAHPYSVWKRGTNENINRLIRRFIPKRSGIGKCSSKDIEMIQQWINNYPRRIFDGKSTNEMLIIDKMA